MSIQEDVKPTWDAAYEAARWSKEDQAACKEVLAVYLGQPFEAPPMPRPAYTEAMAAKLGLPYTPAPKLTAEQEMANGIINAVSTLQSHLIEATQRIYHDYVEGSSQKSGSKTKEACLWSARQTAHEGRRHIQLLKNLVAAKTAIDELRTR